MAMAMCFTPFTRRQSTRFALSDETHWMFDLAMETFQYSEASALVNRSSRADQTFRSSQELPGKAEFELLL